MNNAFKILVGTALGAGVGVAVSKLLASREEHLELEVAGPDGVAFVATPEEQPGVGDRLKARIEAAKQAGEDAKAAKEAELRGYFRQKVDDPTALTVDPLAPTRRES